MSVVGYWPVPNLCVSLGFAGDFEWARYSLLLELLNLLIRLRSQICGLGFVFPIIVVKSSFKWSCGSWFRRLKPLVSFFFSFGSGSKKIVYLGFCSYAWKQAKVSLLLSKFQIQTRQANLLLYATARYYLKSRSCDTSGRSLKFINGRVRFKSYRRLNVTTLAITLHYFVVLF